MDDSHGEDSRLSANGPADEPRGDKANPADEADVSESAVEVTFNAASQRFEAHLAGSVEAAYIDVRPGARIWSFVHTEVPPSFRGRGVGSLLVGAALDHVRELGVTVQPLCPFVVEYLRENPEAADVVDPRFRHLIR